MQDISSVNSGSVGSARQAELKPARHLNGKARTAADQSRPARKPQDRVDLSKHAKLLGRLRDLPSIRVELVAKVRTALALGAYESHDKLDETINRLLDDLDD